MNAFYIRFSALLPLLIASPAMTEELYLITGKAFGACLGEQARYVYNPPESIAEVFKKKCGKLEEQANEQFADFIRDQIGKPLSAETAFKITINFMAGPQVIREKITEAYLSAIRPKAPPQAK